MKTPKPFALLLSVLLGSAPGIWPRLARAEQPAAPTTCEPLEHELATKRAELQGALDALRAAREQASEFDALRETLGRLERERDERGAALDSCRAAREELCAGAGNFARRLGGGRVDLTGIAACVDAGARKSLVDQLSGWSNATTVLGQLGAFSAGDSDAVPTLHGSSGSNVEKLIARLFAAGNGSPLIYRRLLVEALKHIAPKALQELRQQPGGIERWFASDAPLDAAMVAEVHGASIKPLDVQAPALALASSLVQSYELLAGCARAPVARDCARAQQLRQMLESSGPLVARRRVQDVWASGCSVLNHEVVERWIEDVSPVQRSAAQAEEVADAVKSKLFTCFLRDATASESFRTWLRNELPPTASLTRSTLARVVEIESWWKPGSAADRCARAVRALQTLRAPSRCDAPGPLVSAVEPWVAARGRAESSNDFGFEVCDRLGSALWRGKSATLPDTFMAPPTVDDAVRLLPDTLPTNVSRLRVLCGERVGSDEEFEQAVHQLGALGRGLGESPLQPPWNLTRELEPVERARARRGATGRAWIGSLGDDNAACTALELPKTRCQSCRNLSDRSHYDCALASDLTRSWASRTSALWFGCLLAASAVTIVIWSLRLRRALAANGSWLRRARSVLERLGIDARFDGLRYLFPARLTHLQLSLPKTSGWERWGRRAVLLRCESGGFQDRDVNRAGSLARRYGAELTLLVHEDSASPDLSAARAMLEWAARGAGKAVHVLPLSSSRLDWSRNAADLLELAEESSLRGNPFEVRGRVTSSTQFFNRERLVSGLLASAQAGRFTVITGLRRFGKSSLALEVARRLPGPAAYVDLSAFHHEIHFSREPAEAAEAILRFLCQELLQSARARSPGCADALTVPRGNLDATALSAWLRRLNEALTESGGRSAPPALLILDELEHAIGGARELNHALEVFAILVGRLRNTLPGVEAAQRQPIGVLFCSALHPLLWSPLATLAHQSLVGSFEYVAVPCLPEDAAAAMMRGLGSRQGIRFTEASLALLVRESQCVPLLLRRLGSAVLELYDPERARQGALGAVEIGIEGVRAAIEREVSEGSPLRVWIESEIAQSDSPGGVVLRCLAQVEQATAVKLRGLAATAFKRQFELTGLTLELTPGEAQRRADEAAAVVVRTLGESGLLRALGDPTEPEAFELPKGVIRRVLSGESGSA